MSSWLCFSTKSIDAVRVLWRHSPPAGPACRPHRLVVPHIANYVQQQSPPPCVSSYVCYLIAYLQEVLMRPIISVLLLALCFVLITWSQDNPAIEKDKAAIKQAALDYAEGYYEGSGERMERAVHPLLFKRGLVVTAPGAPPFLVFMNSQMLIEAARSGRGKVDPDKRNISFAVLDLNENTATAKIFTVGFNDYLHLAKSDGQWKIVNVLWCPPAQQPSADAARERDAVKQTLSEFLAAGNNKDPEKARGYIHPEIIRRGYVPASPGGKLILQDATGETLLQMVRMGRSVTPKDQPAPEITVLDLYENMASVKSARPNGVDYIHLAKQGGSWRIVNSLGTMFAQPATAK